MSCLTVLSCILGIIILFFLFSGNKQKDILNPIIFFNLWTFIEIIPRVIEIGNGVYTDSQWFRYFGIQIIAVIFTNIGMYFYILSNTYKSKYLFYTEETNDNKLIWFAVVAFMIGLISKLYLLQKSGGLEYVFSHLQIRTQLLAGNGYIHSLGILISVGVACCLKCYYNKKKTDRKIPVRRLLLFIGMLSIGGAALIAFGARAPILELIMALIFLRHYSYKRFTIKDGFKPGTIILAVCVIFFMAMMPLLRYPDTSTLYQTPVKWVQTAISNTSSSIFYEISTVDRDIFTFEHFTTNEKWHGRVYLNIIYQPIPSPMYANKPPMDDGRYLYNLKEGFDVGPNTANAEIPLQTSVPFSSEGILYANFGYVGVLVGSFLIGFLYQYVYKLLKSSNYLVFMVLTYSLIIYQFRVSTLHFLSTLIPIIIMYLFYKIFMGFKVTRIQNRARTGARLRPLPHKQ